MGQKSQFVNDKIRTWMKAGGVSAMPWGNACGFDKQNVKIDRDYTLMLPKRNIRASTAWKFHYLLDFYV